MFLCVPSIACHGRTRHVVARGERNAGMPQSSTQIIAILPGRIAMLSGPAVSLAAAYPATQARRLKEHCIIGRFLPLVANEKEKRRSCLTCADIFQIVVGHATVESQESSLKGAAPPPTIRNQTRQNSTVAVCFRESTDENNLFERPLG